MTDQVTFITATQLNKDSWAFTIPREVRQIMNIATTRYRVLSFILDESNNEISIGFGGERVLGSSEFISSNQVTIPPYARNHLQLEKGKSKLGFYQQGHRILIRKMN